MLQKTIAHDDAKQPTRYGIALVKSNGEIELMSESRETKAEALAEARRLLGWQSMCQVGVCRITVHVGELELIEPKRDAPAPTPLEAAADDVALRSFPA